ncbi:SH3 domain-containing protein [Mangrovicella endophytica]|uniref:SH3 domain-containing protein n=1 Tax=Mangrovicella endophytica TaxID=2066697 RepID=UPI000C9DDF13|nr:SH3 domain-containing protein [Mangrovicella endophytica]
MHRRLLGAAALLGAVLLPAVASAATAIAVTNVNLRAGPSTAYPPVNVVGAGDRVRVFGCLSNRSWCDVSYDGQRGWMSSNYLAYSDRGRRYTGERVVPLIGAPIITYSFGDYWDNHYRGRRFYRDRDRYRDIYRAGPRRDRDWDRRDRDWDRRDRDRDRDWDRRGDRRDWDGRRGERDWDGRRDGDRRDGPPPRRADRAEFGDPRDNLPPRRDTSDRQDDSFDRDDNGGFEQGRRGSGGGDRQWRRGDGAGGEGMQVNRRVMLPAE